MNSLMWSAALGFLLLPCSLLAQDVGGITGGPYIAATPKGGMAGITAQIYDTAPFPKLGGGGFLLDAGVIGRSPKDRVVNGVLSANWIQTWNGFRGKTPAKPYVLPFVTAGLSGFMIDGQGFNYGAGVVWYFAPVKHPTKAIRAEYREFNLPWSTGRLPSLRLSLQFDSTDCL
jgi:hypothetical protein